MNRTNRMNSKTTLKTAIGFVFTFGAVALTRGGANAQVTFAPYGAPGYTNPYGISMYGNDGLGGFSAMGGSDAGFGSPLGGFFGLPLGGNLSFVGGPYSSGYAVLGPNGTTFVDSFQQNIQDNQNLFAPNTQNANNGNASVNSNNVNSNNAVSGSDAATGTPLPLSQSLAVRRGRNFDLSIGWRGAPNLIARVTVTLLNRYHLPVAQQVTEGAAPAYFAANRNTFAARYYRVEVQYADGAEAAITNPLSSATR